MDGATLRSCPVDQAFDRLTRPTILLHVLRHCALSPEVNLMSKGTGPKREQKKKPAKTLTEKRAAKHAKKAERGAAKFL
jgi:hypothetical protein